MKYATIFTALLMSISSHADELKLEVRGNVVAGQPLVIGIWNSKETFDSDKYFMEKKITATGAVTLVTLELPPGRYAIGTYADSNNNGKLETNFVGMPKEMYGFSNDARNRFSRPEWSKASFDLGYGAASQSIHVRHHFD